MLFLSILSILAVHANAEPAALADELLGQSSFRLSRPTDVRLPVQTCGSKGKVRSLQLRVKEGSLNAKSIDAFYLAGGRQRLAANLRLADGQSSGWFVLSNLETPCLSRLELNVDGNRIKTTVEVIGRWE